MPISINDSVRNAMANAAGPLFNAGVVNVYAGSVPANAATALSGQTLLAEVTVANPAFGSATTGTITLLGVPRTDNAINAGGTATFFRFVQGSNTLQGTVGISGSGADMIVDTTTFVLNGVFTINSMTMTVPAA
jgi:hypothetical protein